MTTHLDVILEQINGWDSLFGGAKIDPANIKQADADRIFQKIDGGLSPENLHCDGEASPAHVRKMLTRYEGAVKELVKRGLKPSKPTYCIPQAWLK